MTKRETFYADVYLVTLHNDSVEREHGLEHYIDVRDSEAFRSVKTRTADDDRMLHQVFSPTTLKLLCRKCKFERIRLDNGDVVCVHVKTTRRLTDFSR